MIFLTVGTQFPFDRLVKAADQAIEAGKMDEEICAQVGDSSYRPRCFEAVSHMEKHLFDECVHKASAIIGHAGMGTITTALDQDKPLLVMPRLRKYREAVNDHQLAIARKFEKLGHILVAYDAEELPAKIEALKSFVPRKRKAQPGQVTERISRFLDGLSGSENGPTKSRDLSSMD